MNFLRLFLYKPLKWIGIFLVFMIIISFLTVMYTKHRIEEALTPYNVTLNIGTIFPTIQKWTLQDILLKDIEITNQDSHGRFRRIKTKSIKLSLNFPKLIFSFFNNYRITGILKELCLEDKDQGHLTIASASFSLQPHAKGYILESIDIKSIQKEQHHLDVAVESLQAGVKNGILQDIDIHGFKMTKQSRGEWDQKLSINTIKLLSCAESEASNTKDVFCDVNGINVIGQDVGDGHIKFERITTYITIKNNLYKVKHLKAYGGSWKLPQSALTHGSKEEEGLSDSSLLCALILLDLSYNQENGEMNFNLHIPRESHQPKKKTFEIKTKGSLHILTQLQHKKPLDVPLKGEIVLTINNLSYLLNHLSNIRFISSFENVVGSIIGSPVSKEDISHDKYGKEASQIMTKTTTFNVRFDGKTISVEGVKIYP